MAGSSERRPTVGEIVLLGSLAAYAALSIDLYLPSLPTIADSFRASPGDAARTVSAFFVGLAIGQFLYGPLSDRYGRRPALLAGAALYVAASIFCAVAPTVQALIAGRFVQALGACAGIVVPRAIVRDRYDHTETARIFSLLTLVMGVVPIVAPLLGGWMLGIASWRALFGVLTAFGLTLGVATWLRLDESRSEATEQLAQNESAIQAYWALLSKPRVIGYTLAGALNGACFFTYIASSPDIIIRYFGLPAAHFGWVFGANAAGLVGMSQINRLLLSRWTPDGVLSVGCLAVVGFAALLTLCAVTGAGGIVGVLGPLFLIVATYGFVSANTTAGALSVDPTRAGSISALVGGSGFGAGAIASAAAGWLGDGTPRPVGYVMLVASVLAAVSLHALALPRAGRVVAEEAR